MLGMEVDDRDGCMFTIWACLIALGHREVVI